MTEAVAGSKKFFQENNFVRLTSLLPERLQKVFSTYALMKKQYAFSPDTKIHPSVHGVYGDVLMESLLGHYTSYVEEATGLSLWPSYSYYRVYPSQVALEKKKGRASGEITAVMVLGHNYMEKKDSGYCWKFHLEGPGKEGNTEESAKVYPGDMLVFRGCAFDRWRELFDVAQGGWYVEVYFHYVQKDGVFGDVCKFDGRVDLATPTTMIDMTRAFEKERVDAKLEDAQEKLRQDNRSLKLLSEGMLFSSKPLDRERMELNSEDDLNFELVHVGEGGCPVVVVDNLYKDPEYVRDVAASLYYKQSSELGYSTLSSLISLPMNDFWTRFHESFAHLYGITKELVRSSARPFFCFYKSEGSLPATLEGGRNFLQGMIFLNLPEQGGGELRFHQQKKWNMKDVVIDEEVLELAYYIKGLKNPRRALTRLEQKTVKNSMDKGLFSHFFQMLEEGKVEDYTDYIRIWEEEKNRVSEASWETIQTVEIKENRLICSPAFLIHSLWMGGNASDALVQHAVLGWPRNVR